MCKTTLNSDIGREKSKAKDSMRYFNPKRDKESQNPQNGSQLTCQNCIKIIHWTACPRQTLLLNGW